MKWFRAFVTVLLGGIPVLARAEYTSLVPSGELTGISGDVNTVAMWAVGICITIAAVGILARTFGR